MAQPKAAGAGFARSAAKALKGQPWILYDTVASRSFLAGEKDPALLAIGTSAPAIGADGRMIFFNAGRTKAQPGPFYTNVDAAGLMSYGLEVWGIYCMIVLAAQPTTSGEFGIGVNPNATAGARIAESVINGGVLSLDLGQESQVEFPVHRFGAGGGIAVDGIQLSLPHNGTTHRSHMMVLPEPVQMPRTQNLTAQIRLSPEALAVLGNPTAPGYGAPFIAETYQIPTTTVPPPDPVKILPAPFMVQIGLVGKRIKKLQYGQTG